MRRLKFRVYDKKFKRMYYEGFYISAEGDLSFDLKIFKPGEYAPLEMEIMQFTGLEDKNGVEIYEGDILALINSEFDGKQNSFGKVQVLFGEYDDSEMEYGSAGVGWYVEGYNGYKRIDGRRDYYKIGGSESQWSILRCIAKVEYDDKWEVIGNIYQHPHLLKAEGKEESNG